MLKDLLKDAYFNRLYTLYKKGLEEHKIIPFDNEFYEKMSNTYINTIPVSMHIKYLKPNDKEGKCFDRSLYMFYALDNVKLVRADNKDLEYRYGKNNSRHGWIEDDCFVYDPSLLSKIDKKLYYKMYMPQNIERTTKEEYLKNDINKKTYNDIVNTKIEDFMKDGNKRSELLGTIPLIKELAFTDNDENFKKDLKKKLKKIDYNYNNIYKKTATEYKELLLFKKII